MNKGDLMIKKIEVEGYISVGKISWCKETFGSSTCAGTVITLFFITFPALSCVLYLSGGQRIVFQWINEEIGK